MYNLRDLTFGTNFNLDFNCFQLQLLFLPGQKLTFGDDQCKLKITVQFIIILRCLHASLNCWYFK